MYQIDFKKPQHVHFIGIGGISMSGLAEILLKENFQISGSDNKPSALTEHLTQLGAVVNYPQMASNITDGIDVVVYTAAIHPDNPEKDSPHVSTLERICKPLGVEIWELFYIGDRSFVALQAEIALLKSERDSLLADNAVLKDKVDHLKDKVDSLKDDLIATLKQKNI